MNEITEKYLARMLEGAEQGLSQLYMAVQQINGQLENMADQREEMEEAVRELKELLGLEDEVQKPELLVEDNVDQQA